MLRGPALIDVLRLVIAGETFVPRALVDGPLASATALPSERRQRAVLGNLPGARSRASGACLNGHFHDAFRKMVGRRRADAVRKRSEPGVAPQ